ncbi:MAG: hypothetical protein IPL61_19170 [Myxococcales bacterium]|nr:hypothetical protein [Myxococcales bacterium]
MPRRPPVLAIALVIAGVLVLAPRGARAQGDFFSSSPGALAESHASIDGPDHCNDCHDNGREAINSKCLGCHDHNDLRTRINAGKGFHASSQVSGKKCSSCHNEHKGRGFDLMGWAAIPGGTKGFDHDVTGWKLEGKHAAVDCADCHKTRNRQGLRTYLNQDRLCGTCHKKDQPHGFERREMLACERCHAQSVWNPPKSDQDFDHDSKADASMPLLGSHADVSCEKCHPKALFNLKGGNPDFCGNCHDSPHDGMLFGKRECEWCHSPKFGALDKFKFDHDKKTTFALGRAHAKMKCEDCHTTRLGERKPDKTCEAGGCHQDDNKHGARFSAFGGDPPACATCHLSSTSWGAGATNFNHDKRTKFKLTGRHDQVSCRSCHRGRSPADFEQFDPRTVGCRGCHQHKNVHPKEKYTDSQCLGCHQGAGNVNLKPGTVDTFHGPKSAFPLVKGHKPVKCVQCHPKDSFKDTPSECGVRCHEDSLHKGSLGDECSRCHLPGVWDAVRFDHADDTKWPLEGLHAKIADCSDCHPTRAYTGTPKTCSAEGCHAKDDVHKGRLGQGCERCHKVTGDNVFNHNSMSSFALTGQHLTVRCSECHTSQTFKPRPQNCFGCHPEPGVHKGQYGTACEACHSTQDWTDIKPLHDVGGFALVGSHDNLACARCHKDSRPMAGTGNLCINCHRQDDIHQNSLTPRCGECHTQFTFAPARFDHTTVGCNLTGLHRTLACADCHRAGNYGAQSAECVACHLDDAARSPHELRSICTGGGCHSPTRDWSPTATNYGRESICR